MRGMEYTARQKQAALKMWLADKVDILKVAYTFKCTERSLWRWKAKYDGTLQSLENGSKVPHTPHPNAHSAQEEDYIRTLFNESPDISYTEALGELRTKFGYSRTYFGFYRFVVKHGLRPSQEIKQTPYEPKPYNTPEMLGHKWQMDVKYVPRECNKGAFRKEWYYQYTMIDEATRERFLYPYKEKSGYSTVDFTKRAIAHFGYVPEIIQTDNGTEFTNPQWAKADTIHIFDKLMSKIGIKHQLIRVRTPRHNGKVERSHRSDQEAFYNHLTFTTYEELKEKMQAWNIRYNNRPHSQLRDKNGKRAWLTPLQKRAELLELLKENREKYRVRFLKGRAA